MRMKASYKKKYPFRRDSLRVSWLSVSWYISERRILIHLVCIVQYVCGCVSIMRGIRKPNICLELSECLEKLLVFALLAF